MLDKSIVDLNGNIIYSHILMDENNNILFSNIEIKITKDMQIVDMYDKSYVTPKWNGTRWIEGATDEEIKVWREENKVVKTPTTEELLLKEIANLKIEIMQLKGGNA